MQRFDTLEAPDGRTFVYLPGPTVGEFFTNIVPCTTATEDTAETIAEFLNCLAECGPDAIARLNDLLNAATK